MLSDAIRDCYQEWIDAAPPEYKQTLCGSSLPLSISSKHGQNRKIWADDFSINEEEQRQFWNNSVDLRYIHIYRVAFALHLQFVSSLLTSFHHHVSRILHSFSFQMLSRHRVDGPDRG